MKSSTSRLIVLSLQSILLILADTSNLPRAQDLDNVTISGRVLDQNGAVIPGATVLAIFIKTGASRSTETNAQGRYRLIQLQPGSYTLRVSLAGFDQLEKKDLTTVAGQNVQIDFTLFPQRLFAEPLTIKSSESAIVDTTRTVVGTTINVYQIETLPIASRSPLDLMFTLPGVSEEPLSTRDLSEDRNTSPANTPEEAGTFSLSGAPAYSNNLTIDGLDNNDDRAARERFQPSLEAVEEVQVITNQFSAEYGRASGGRVNIRTRSGSNELRGRVFYFFRDEALNANTFRNNTLGLPRLPLQEHAPGFTLGGPLLLPSRKASNRTFFFTSYEFQKVLDSALVDTLVPVQQNNVFPLPSPTSLTARRLENADLPARAAEIAPFVSSVSTPLRNTIMTARVDHSFGPTYNASFVFHGGRQHNLRQFGGGNRLAETFQGKLRNSDAISYSDTYVFTPTLVSQTRLQYSRLAPAVRARGRSTPVVLITINDSLEASDPARRSGTLVAGSSTAGATTRQEERLQFQHTLSLLHREHSLKFGLDTQRIRSTFIDLADASGTFNFASAGDFLTGIPSRFRQNFETASTQQNFYTSLFVQDEWRLRSNLIITFGLRYERESIISDRNNFGARFSVAFDPFNSGKTVLRFGFGSFFNRVLLRTVDDFTLGKQQLFFDTNALRDPLTETLLSPEQRRLFIASHLRFPETLHPDSPLVKAFGTLNRNFSRRLDPGLRIPESYQANFGVERDLGKGFAIEANFTLSRSLHLWREFNANAPRLPRNYENFSEYLASRDFPNFRPSATASRPLYNAASSGELVRFVFHPLNPANPNSIVSVFEFGVPVSLVNLNSTSSTAVEIALAALNQLRPDPGRGEVEQLISAGNSFYDGLTIEVRRSLAGTANSPGLFFRAAYTFSHLTDDGIVNTSDALNPGDFRAERARSLLERRHRFVFSGSLELPRMLARIRFAPILRLTSGAPFNISLGGVDRNLDDVANDRPVFHGDPRLLRWRPPGQTLASNTVGSFALPTIGQSGNLARNAGRGPGQFFFDLSISRTFQVSNHVRVSPVIEFDNVLNKTVFSFGSEFINFNSLSSTASAAQRQAFLDSFLVATRTLRPRQLRLGVRIDF
jgi:hypothetical protein